MNGWEMNAGVAWLAAALALGIGELVVPGVFLVFLGIAAAIIGVAALVLPGLTLPAQLGAFAVWSVVAVLIGRRWYRDYPVATTDPLLNDRGARMIGQVVTVEQAIVDGAGRVQVGDGGWPALGPDLPAGTRVRIVGRKSNVLIVEPVEGGDGSAALGSGQ